MLDERQFEKRSLYIRINVHPLMYGGGNNARCMALPLDMFVAFYRGGIFGLSVRVRERETDRERERSFFRYVVPPLFSFITFLRSDVAPTAKKVFFFFHLHQKGFFSLSCIFGAVFSSSFNRTVNNKNECLKEHTIDLPKPFHWKNYKHFSLSIERKLNTRFTTISQLSFSVCLWSISFKVDSTGS